MNSNKKRRKFLIVTGILVLLLQGCGPENIQTDSDPINEEQTDSVQEAVQATGDQEMEEESENVIEEIEEIPEEAPFHVRTEIQVEAGTEALEMADFLILGNIEELSIATDLTKEELSRAGAEYEVTILCQDKEINVLVKVIDTIPPIINGAKDITIRTEESVSYRKNISLWDNSDGEVNLEIDSSAVDTQKTGNYPVKYIATDESGNVATEEITLYVIGSAVIDETTVAPMADEVIAQVITPDMSKYDMAYALWSWCRNNIYYNSLAGDYNELWRSAYQGLHDRKGSCYAYAYTYSLLLSRCGIDNVCVMRLGGTTDHIWNLVNTGNGWYHCDASPRRKGDSYLCFMQTDAQVQAYTDSYPEKPNYYTFDLSLYPERATDIIFGN